MSDLTAIANLSILLVEPSDVQQKIIIKSFFKHKNIKIFVFETFFNNIIDIIYQKYKWTL